MVKLFQYTLLKDPDVFEIIHTMPNHEKYTLCKPLTHTTFKMDSMAADSVSKDIQLRDPGMFTL